MKKLLTLVLMAFIIFSCNKKDNSLNPNNGIKDVETGIYQGAEYLVLFDSAADSTLFLGSQNETVTIEHVNGSIYLIKSNNKIPNIKIDLKKAGTGYGFFIIDGQKCEYGDLVGVPMSSFGMGYSGSYNPSKHSFNCGFYPDYVPTYAIAGIVALGGIVIKNSSSDIVGFIQMAVTKK